MRKPFGGWFKAIVATLVVAGIAYSGYMAVRVSGSAASDPVLLGYMGVASQDDSSAPNTEAFGFTASFSGTATSMSVYLDSETGVALGLYSDTPNGPGELLDAGAVTSNKAGWVTINLTGGVQIEQGTRYWAAIAPENGNTPVYRDTAGGSNLDYTEAGGLPATFVSNGNWSSNPASVYVSGTTTPSSSTTTTSSTTPTSSTSTTTPTTTTPTTTTTTAGGGGGGLPPGVTLQQIDGGPQYYCGNGFTYACNAGWDNLSFFPIIDDYSFYPSHNVAAFKSLGVNTSVRVTGDTNLSLLNSNSIWAIPSPGEGSNPGSETVGWHVEEPNGWSGITSQLGGANVAGRFLQASFTWDQFVYGGLGGGCGSSMQDTMSCTSGIPQGRHLDIPTADIYWFAGQHTDGLPYECGLIYNVRGNCTTDQMARGSNYGDMVDQMRQWTNGDAPTAPYIETGDGLVGLGEVDITPPELNWAVWSTLIHGARWVLYFGTTSDEGCGATFGFCTNVLPGQTISDYQQAAATNAQVESLAPILNSPFALNYASVTPAGYVFPTPHVVLDTGIDISTHYYTNGAPLANGFYIFATPRGSEAQTNINATFTTADGYTGPVTVVGENRTVQATNGIFADTFADGSTVHIYQVP
jgi:hypothetical protein